MSQATMVMGHKEVATREADYPAAQETPEFTPLARKVIISMLVFEVVLLASIWGWLWYGMHQYQNCL